MTETVLDRVLDSLRSAANISRVDQVRPAAVLWTDQERQWLGLAERLRATLPELLILGDHAPEARRGPAIWIKCMLARAQDFVPSHGTLDKPLNTALLRRVLKDAGWQVLGGGDAGDPSGRAWTEIGDLDHYGHEHGLRLAREVPVILEAVVEQVRFLVDAGWKMIRIVTDHGWLLVPGGMPKTALAKFLTATRWGRCAALSDTAKPTELTLTWRSRLRSTGAVGYIRSSPKRFSPMLSSGW